MFGTLCPDRGLINNILHDDWCTSTALYDKHIGLDIISAKAYFY